MAAAQPRPTKQTKPSMFRRILSPRDHKAGKHDKTRASSMTEVNGHRRNNSDDLQGSVEISNIEYRDPVELHQQYPYPPPPPGRSQSMVYPPASHTFTESQEHPPLPPRNVRPVSMNNPHPLHRTTMGDGDDSPLYVEPANTLKKMDPSVVSNYSQVEPSESVPTRQDIKQMSMHIQTMQQKQSRGHRRARSGGHVIDKSEYSTPYDLLKQNQAAKEKGQVILPAAVRSALAQSQRHSEDPPPKPPSNHKKHIRQTEPLGDRDGIIPVVSPTPPPILSDRSHTSSPSSPLSTQSSEQEFIRDDGTNDYDEPWENKFKNLNMPKIPRTTSSARPETEHIHRPQRHSQPHPHNDIGSPPSPGPVLRPYRSRDHLSISPEVPNDRPPAFVKGPERSSGRREGSVSPNPRVRDIRSFSHSQLPPHHSSHHRFDDNPLETNTRASSMSIMAGRQLPPTPPDRRILTREPSPPPALIDISIPLDDQPWYHGPITRVKAETVLADQPDFSFLVRKSESSNTNFSLSIRDYSSGFIHLRIILETGPNPGYVLGQFSVNFNTVQECVSFYTKQKLNIRGAEHKRLGLPIPRANNSMAMIRM